MIKIALALSLLCLSLLNTTGEVLAIDVNINQQPGQGIIATGFSAEGIVQVILLNVITLFFAVGGIGVVIYFIWGAVDWILSAGDKEKVSNARKKMTNAIIGLILLSMSFAIIRTVGAIAGFDPLGNLQLRGLGDGNSPPVRNSPTRPNN